MLVPNKAYVNYEGDDYEVDPTTFSFVESAINQAKRSRKAATESGTGTACQEGRRRSQRSATSSKT